MLPVSDKVSVSSENTLEKRNYFNIWYHIGVTVRCGKPRFAGGRGHKMTTLFIDRAIIEWNKFEEGSYLRDIEASD
jgi:hypothetical protein